MPEFELTASPSPEELAAITDALSAFNNSDVGPSNRFYRLRSSSATPTER